MTKIVSDQEFIKVWRETGSPALVQEVLGLKNLRGVYARRKKLEEKYGISLKSTIDQTGRSDGSDALPRQGIRRIADVRGRVIVFSDAHFWPGADTIAYKALMALLPERKPRMVVANGDILDGARISRHDRIGWENRPSLKDELDASSERMDAIRSKSRQAIHVFNLGNHDVRLARYLAMNAPEMEGVPGSELGDHIRHWQIGWSLLLNEQVMVKHRYNGGVHAAWNNVMKAGITMVTGHTHALEARPFWDYRGLRWGCQTGTLLDLGPEDGPTFYREDDPQVTGRPGFLELTFDKDGRLLPPLLCEVVGGHAYFCGERVT